MTAISSSLPSIRSLMRHVGFGASLTIGQAVAGFVMAAINVRLMTQEDFAGLAVILAVTAGVIHMMGSALATLAAREGALATSKEVDRDQGTLLFFVLSGIFAMSVAYFSASMLVGTLWSNASDISCVFAGLSAAFGTSTVISSGLLQGLGRPLRAHLGVMGQAFFTLILCLFAVAASLNFSLDLLILFHAVASGAVSVWAFNEVLRTARRKSLKLNAPPKHSLKPRVQFLFPLWVSMGLSALALKLPTIFAGLILAPALVVVFAISLQFGGLARSLPSILSRSLSRSIQQSYSDGQYETLRTLVRKGELIAFSSALLITAGFSILGKYVLEFGFNITDSMAFWLTLSMIIYGGMQVTVSIRQGILGMLGFTLEVMAIRALELTVLASALTVVYAMGLGIWGIIASIFVTFLTQASAARIVMRKRKIFG